MAEEGGTQSDAEIGTGRVCHVTAVVRRPKAWPGRPRSAEVRKWAWLASREGRDLVAEV